MKTKIFNLKANMFRALISLSILSGGVFLASCSDFLDEHVPQGTLSNEQVKSPENAEAMVVSAYAIFTSAEDINSSFSMWNFDVRSDDAYKGGSGTSGGIFRRCRSCRICRNTRCPPRCG